MKHNLFCRLTCLLLVVVSVFCLTTSALAADENTFKPLLISSVGQKYSAKELVSSTYRDTVAATLLIEYALNQDTDLYAFDFSRNSYIGLYDDGGCIDLYLAKAGGTGYINLFYAPVLDEITIFTGHSRTSQSSLVSEYPKYSSISGSDLLD